MNSVSFLGSDSYFPLGKCLYEDFHAHFSAHPQIFISDWKFFNLNLSKTFHPRGYKSHSYICICSLISNVLHISYNIWYQSITFSFIDLGTEWDFNFNYNLSHKQLIYLHSQGELHVSNIHAYEVLWKSWQIASKCPIFEWEKLFSCSMKGSKITLFSFFKVWHLQRFLSSVLFLYNI